MSPTKLVIGALLFCVLTACGGIENSSPNPLSTAGTSGTVPPGQEDMTAGAGEPGPNAPPEGGVPKSNGEDVDPCVRACTPGDCGKIGDGCGDFLDCGDCEDGLVCGALTPNRCDTPPPDPCTPLTAAELCTSKCGAVSDGCSGVVYCNADNGGVSCLANQFCVDSACEDPVPPICIPETCADKNHQCGVDGDGCGGSIECGTCTADDVCSYQDEGNRCVPAEPITCTPMPDVEACAGTCGIVGDGCGGQLRCQDNPLTACPEGTTCGGGGEAGVCGTGQTCEKLEVSVACAGKCGSQSDGCGETYQCDNTNGGQTCDTRSGEICGGAGIANQCGAPACVPKTLLELCPGSALGKSCGLQNNGCNNLVDCGGCPQDETCGLYEPSICGAPPPCVPVPAAVLCAGKCGSVQEPNCGGLYKCSSENGGISCTGQEYCGALDQPNQCGLPPQSCVPQTCAEFGHGCGLSSDGCGHIINCWPGCEGTSDCTGGCEASATCLADLNSGIQACVSGGSRDCAGSLCDSLPGGCLAGSSTKLTGTVRTPGRLDGAAYVNQLPVPNAVVYIPADPGVALPAIFEGAESGNTASCGRCDDEELVADGQTVLAAAVTDFKGEFTLQGRIPVGAAFKLVVKVGKWRRVVQVPAGISESCESRALPLEYTRLAAHTTDGLSGTHLPKIAVSTGQVDAMECVLRGIGFADSEFSLKSGSGRVHMYWANGTSMPSATCTGTYRSGATDLSCANNSNEGCRSLKSGCKWNNADTALYASQSALNAYDMVVFDCEGSGHYVRPAAERARLLSYADAGGRVFASHWSYEWLDNNGTMDGAASWTNSGSDNVATGFVSLPSGSTARGGANAVKSPLYRDWLDYLGALTGTSAGRLDQPNPPRMPLTDPRDVAGSNVGAAADEWMYRDASGKKVQQLSFNTPYAAAEEAICGRVAFSAFHVAASAGGSTLTTSNLTFPEECHDGELTAQELTLAFMLFDLGACVSAGDPPQPPACDPKTTEELCPQANDACGYISDACGGVVDCGGCDGEYYCDGNLCRPQECTPLNCAAQGYNCGSWADGCGGVARNSQGVEGCGECSGGQTCGLTSPGICGGCVQIPLAIACPSNSCGAVSNGCGGTFDCGTCAEGFCGGGGANLCGMGSCTPLSQSQACSQKDCGLVADGCGGTLNCGSCAAPDTCGGGGAPNVCGHPTCKPKTVKAACSGLSCGWVSDGCGGALNCGTCSDGGVCGGEGPNQCGGYCNPTTCTAAGAQCGAIADRCGGLLDCGPCPHGETCGASSPNRCGIGPLCAPRTCQIAEVGCGLIGDGCGGALDCGDCTAPESCGGAGVPNQCGTGTGGCNKLTCLEQGVLCGAASDGCGGLLDCGGCPSGSYCANSICNPALE